MQRIILTTILAISIYSTRAQIHTQFAREEGIVLKTPSCDIQGTLMMPFGDSVTKVVLIISGNGPTDRDGNQAMMKNNSLKLMALELASNNIASVRYDKRAIGASKLFPESTPNSLTLSDYVSDVKDWITLLRRDRRFSKIYLMGHSEGALLAIAAAAGGSRVDGVISIAGPGRTMDQLLKDQLMNQPPQIREMAYKIIDTLAMGKTAKQVPVFLKSLFTPGIQPYLISMIECSPQAEIRKLHIPILILQGDSDIQVRVEDARLLNAANPRSRLVIIVGMNHVLKDCPTPDRDMQLETYINPALPLNFQCVNEVVGFLSK